MSSNHDPFQAGDEAAEPAYDIWRGEPALPHEVGIGSRRVFDGRLLHVRVDDVRLPSGRESVREIVEHPGSVVIVPLTVDRDVLLIRQFRYATGEYLLELPAGLIDPGEHFMAAAGRELIEETGYKAESLRHLTTVYVSPGYSQERTAIVLAIGCREVKHASDPDEPIEVLHRPLASLAELLVPGDTSILDAQAMLGIMWLERLVAAGEV